MLTQLLVAELRLDITLGYVGRTKVRRAHQGLTNVTASRLEGESASHSRLRLAVQRIFCSTKQNGVGILTVLALILCKHSVRQYSLTG
jgi:hypothetical protein